MLTILFLFLNYWLRLMNSATIAEIFNNIAELLISKGILSKEAKAEIEIHPVITKAKIRKCSI